MVSSSYIVVFIFGTDAVTTKRKRSVFLSGALYDNQIYLPSADVSGRKKMRLSEALIANKKNTG